eukprot:449036-Prymnesium_polylepis.2
MACRWLETGYASRLGALYRDVVHVWPVARPRVQRATTPSPSRNAEPGRRTERRAARTAQRTLGLGLRLERGAPGAGRRDFADRAP